MTQQETGITEYTQEIQQVQNGIMQPVNADQIARSVVAVKDVMEKVMQEGVHYGTIPGTGKPSLYQPGAQTLLMTFRLRPEFDVTVKDIDNNHREYSVICRLYSISTGEPMGQGVGLATTMESRYRYRNSSDYEITGDPIPADAKERKQQYRKQGYGMKKIDGAWEWVKYTSDGKVENPDIADTYNTVLKIASKRALVHATINTTGCSDMFTQDIEDFDWLRHIDTPQTSQNRPTTPHNRPTAPQTYEHNYTPLTELKDRYIAATGVDEKQAANDLAQATGGKRFNSLTPEQFQEALRVAEDFVRQAEEAAQSAQAAIVDESPEFDPDSEEIPF